MTKQERMMQAAKRAIPALVEMMIAGGMPVTEASVTECVIEYGRQIARLRDAYYEDAEARDELRDLILTETYRRIRERHGLAA